MSIVPGLAADYKTIVNQDSLFLLHPTLYDYEGLSRLTHITVHMV